MPALKFVRPGRALVLSILCLAASACSPRLDWREVQPEDASALLRFPCKPDLHHRAAATQQPAMGLAVCKAGGQSFSLSWADIPDPAQVGPAMAAMRSGLLGRMSSGQAPVSVPQPVQVSGMTPQAEAVQLHVAVQGQHARVAVFARGLRVYQLLMVGDADDAAAFDIFLESVHLQ